MDVDYRSQGRNTENLGLAEMNASEILQFLNEGSIQKQVSVCILPKEEPASGKGLRG